jgi:hypothetical protein
MICPYCGKENPENTQICNYCAGPLEIPTEEKVAEPFSIETQVSVSQPPTPPQVPNAVLSKPPVKSSGGILYGNKIWWFVGCFLVVFVIVACGVVAWGLYNFSGRIPFLNLATPTATSPAAPTAVKTPVIIPSLSPSVSPLPEVTFTPNTELSNSAVIFSDDFSDPQSGWDRADEADYYTDYYENSYRIIVNSDMSDSWANPDDNLFDDVIVEVDATKNAGPDDNDFGLICRSQSMNQFYYAVISSDGYYGISKVILDGSELVGRDSLEYSNTINQGFATNHIRFDCIGDKLTLYVNGQQIDQQTDTDYTNGNVGLLAGTYDTPGTDILFDNFFVYQP